MPTYLHTLVVEAVVGSVRSFFKNSFFPILSVRIGNVGTEGCIKDCCWHIKCRQNLVENAILLSAASLELTSKFTFLIHSTPLHI